MCTYVQRELLCVCVHVQACPCPVCGSEGNRWEVCHVLVNKSVIVLYCPAWLSVSCAGSSFFPLNPGMLRQQPRMPAHTQHSHDLDTHIKSRTHPVMRTQTDSVMHQLVACNWIGTWSVIFPIWWPDASQWKSICSPFSLPHHSSRLQPHGLRCSHTSKHETDPSCTHTLSFTKSLRNGASGHSCISVTQPNNNTPSTALLFTFWKS